MSQERFGEATRRAFLGTATAATAATLTAPVVGEAQAAETSPPVGTTKLAKRVRMFRHSWCPALKRVTGQSRRRWQSRKRDISRLRQGRYGPFIRRRRPIMDSRSSQRSNRVAKK